MKDYITYATPPPAPEPRPMGFPDLRGEWRVAREAARVGLSSPQLLFAPRGTGERVLLIPGFKAPESSMYPLRRLLRLKGYDAYTWGQGTNQGDVQRYLDRLRPDLMRRTEASGQPEAIVGWSLGGVIARELARTTPASVSTVITYGSPVIGGPIFTVGANNYSAVDRKRINRLIAERNRDLPIRTPLGIIFSRRDTIVSWPACIDRYSAAATHYEVDSTHFSMGIDPTVWGIVLDRLASVRSHPEAA